MGHWMLDVLLVAIAVLLMAVAVYKVMFSAAEEERREMQHKPRLRFERRELERRDRRQRRGQGPGGIERRQLVRR